MEEAVIEFELKHRHQSRVLKSIKKAYVSVGPSSEGPIFSTNQLCGVMPLARMEEAVIEFELKHRHQSREVKFFL